MSKTETQCLILAAGAGRRIRAHSCEMPKPLVRLRGVPLIEHVVLSAQEAGIRRFVIVTGYRGEMIRRWFALRNFGGIEVKWVSNLEYQKDNGVSVLKARQFVEGPFLLVMSDHVFEPATARALLSQPFGRDHAILAVDSNIDRIFDLDDATKVLRAGSRIIKIGKDIPQYDALDTGMFYCRPTLFHTLDSVLKDGNCSLSDGMRELGRRGQFRAFDIGAAHWQDVDTPQALSHTEQIFDQDFATTPVGELLARAA